MKDIVMNFPYCKKDSSLYYRIVLIEKSNGKPFSMPARCCSINGVVIFTDPYSTKDFFVQRNGFSSPYILIGFESERVKTDSEIIQSALKAINSY